MIEKLIAALQIEEVKELTGELTGEQLVDVLWLWSKKLSKASNYSLSNQDSRTNSTQEVEELTRPIQKDDDEDVHPQPTPREAIPKKADTPLEPQNTSQQTATGTGVYPKTTSETQESKSAGDLSIRLPNAPSLREKLKLSRSLKSLMRWMPSTHNTVLDEVATVEQIAEKQIWIPVLNPALEPWLELTLVVDESASMLIWRDTIIELRQLLEHLGIFRDVRTWGLFTNSKGVVQIRPEIGSVARNQSARSPRELVDPNGRRLILILSDCVSPMWRKQRKENEVIQALNIWANSGPMAIVQMLPKWLWSRTALGLAAAVQLCGLTPGVANQQLLFRQISAWDEIDEARDIKVPVLTLEPTMVATWSQMVAGMGTIWVSGFMFQADFGTVDEDDDPDTNSTQELTAQRSFQRFRLTASPMARRLAGLVAAAPIVSLPVIRLIQETMLPESQQVHVAEVLLGGLLKLKSTTKIETDTNPNEVEYQFIDGVSEILLESLPASDRATVKITLLQRLAKYMADRIGLSRETFAGFLKDPRLINSTTQQINPIAIIGVQALKRLGEEYASLAEELEKDFQVPFSPKIKKIYALLVFIQEAESSENAYYELEAHQGQYWINQASDRKSIVAPIPLVPDTQGYTQQRAVQIIKRLEHVARWMNVLDLKTPPTSQIKPSDVELEVIVSYDGQAYSSTQVSDLRGEYTFKNNKWTPPEIKLKVTNHSKQDIYFQIVELAGNYSISIPEFFTERGSIVLSKKSSDGFIPSSTTSETLDLVIPRAYLDSGVTEYNDIFKLIVSDKDFDASLLAQKGLDTPPVTRSTGLSGALNRSMDNVSSRQSERWQDENIEYVPSDGSALRRKSENWMTKEVKLTLVKPLSGGN
jgi:hypothetical protein